MSLYPHEKPSTDSLKICSFNFNDKFGLNLTLITNRILIKHEIYTCFQQYYDVIISVIFT